MSSQPIDYESVLADMEAKREALESAIRNMRLWLGLAPVQNSRSAVAESVSDRGIASDAFFGISIPDAVEKLLTISKKKLSTNDIATALERGGITHSSKNFRNTVSTALYREDIKSDARIVKVAEGEWGLVDWYPGIKTKRAKQVNRLSPEENANGTYSASTQVSEPEPELQDDYGQGITDDDVPF